MPLTMFSMLEGALNELGDDEFNRFVLTLVDPELQQRVEKCAVERKTRGEVAGVLIQRFTQDGALNITTKVLRSMGANLTAKNLQTTAADNGFSPSPGGPPSAVTPYDEASKAAFIDDQWVELVKKATSMNGILDILLGKKVINHGQYSDLRSKQTQQDKMRCLINEELVGTASGKAVLYDVLLKEQPFMMKDLGAS